MKVTSSILPKKRLSTHFDTAYKGKIEPEHHSKLKVIRHSIERVRAATYYTCDLVLERTGGGVRRIFLLKNVLDARLS